MTPFYRAALYALRSFLRQRCLSVCLSVRPSVTRVNCDKTNQNPAEILIPCMKVNFMQFFGQKEWLVGDAPCYMKFWVRLTHPASKMTIFTRYLLIAAQPLDLAKKVNYD